MRLFLFLIFVFFSVSSGAQEFDFKKQNPDIAKYDFIKDYILSLGYYHRVTERSSQESDQITQAGGLQGTPIIKKIIHYRILDNTEIRIARNYLLKYTKALNPLMVKIVEDTIQIYDQLLALNIQERLLWEHLYEIRSGQTMEESEEDVLQKHFDLAEQKKVISKDLIKSSHLLSILVLSAQKCQNQNCYDLALTQKQRNSLIEKLNVFASDVPDWGLKPGQTTRQASIAVIREVLEDPLYLSKP